MKKFIAVVLALAMILAFAGCGKKEEPQKSAMESLPKDATPAQIVCADFTDKVNNGEFKTMEALAESLVTADHIEFGGACMPVEEGYLNGFTDEVKGFKEGATFGPMIGSIPFVGYVFVLADGVKADEFVENLKSLADLRWNICTAADEMNSAVVGNTVCFVMAPKSFED